MAQQPPSSSSSQPQASSQTALPPVAPGPTDLQSLQKAVANEVSVDQSAIKLIQGFSKSLTQMASGQDSVPASDLQDLAKQLNDSANALAAAVKANTPAAKPQ